MVIFSKKKYQGHKVIAWPWNHLIFLKFSMRAKYGVSFSYASKGIANAIGLATNEFLNVCPFDYTAVAGSGKVGP